MRSWEWQICPEQAQPGSRVMLTRSTSFFPLGRPAGRKCVRQAAHITRMRPKRSHSIRFRECGRVTRCLLTTTSGHEHVNTCTSMPTHLQKLSVKESRLSSSPCVHERLSHPFQVTHDLERQHRQTPLVSRRCRIQSNDSNIELRKSATKTKSCRPKRCYSAYMTAT